MLGVNALSGGAVIVIPIGFDPAKMSANLTRSSNNYTLKNTDSVDGWESGLSVNSRSTGKFYIECTTDTTPVVSGSLMIGLSSSPSNFGALQPGGNASSWGDQAGNGILSPAGTKLSVYFNNVQSGPSFSGNYTNLAGETANIAVDLDAGKIWFGSGGAWCGSGDPAAGTNQTYSFTANTALYVMLGIYEKNHQVSVNFGQNNFVYAAPSGFGIWG